MDYTTTLQLKIYESKAYTIKLASFSSQLEKLFIL